jgi:ParB-like chromosome segregation protein Spo0J
MSNQRVVPLGDIVVDPALQIRDALDEQTVAAYMEDFDLLPAVLVFETPAGLLLADGFHRLEAAHRLGRAEIAAEVRSGSRTDALDEAIKVNLRHGQRYSRAERSKAIRLFEEHHPDWSARQIAAQLGCSHVTVFNIKQARQARQRARDEGVLAGLSEPEPELSETHYMAIGSAPAEHQGELAHAADERDWTIGETQLAARNLKDERVPEPIKENMLAGYADPVVVREDGSFELHPDTVRREVGLRQGLDYKGWYLSAIAALARLDTASVDDVAADLGPEQRQRALEPRRGLPHYIQLLQDLKRAIEDVRPDLKVVNDE